MFNMGVTPWEYKQFILEEFRSPAFYRDLFAEFLATFILMCTQCTLPADWGTDQLGGAVQQALGMGFIVGATAWTLGDFGGAHMNPAVSFSMMISCRTTITRALIYMVIQCTASIAAAAFIQAIHPPNMYIQAAPLAVTVLNPDMEAWQGVMVEVWLTFVLMLTVLGATNQVRKKNSYMSTIFITMAVFNGVANGQKSTGGSMNPARSLGPAVIRGVWENHWIYWVGPLTGSTLATFVYHVVLDMVDDPSRATVAPRAERDIEFSVADQTDIKPSKVRFPQDVVTKDEEEIDDEESRRRIEAVRKRGRSAPGRQSMAAMAFYKRGGGIIY